MPDRSGLGLAYLAFGPDECGGRVQEGHESSSWYFVAGENALIPLSPVDETFDDVALSVSIFSWQVFDSWRNKSLNQGGANKNAPHCP